MNSAVLLLGSNLGDRILTIKKALEMIEKEIGSISLLSRFYKTGPWGEINQDDYINIAAAVNTSHTPQEVMLRITGIETNLGRVREGKWKPRTIDIDIMFYNDEVINLPGLKIPHPLVQDRRFALVPLCEIIPGYTHPVLKKTIRQLLACCSDISPVTILDPTS